ncbi:hypothetical protein JOQ06_029929, partial [Pogonophryne albipinna]
MYSLDISRAQNEDTASCTSRPQQWHKPRGKKVAGQPISSAVVAKAKLNRKRRPVVPTYTPNRSQESEEIYETLRGIRGTPISYIVNQTPIQVAVGGKDYPIGCGLSYLLPQTNPATSLPVSSSCTKTIPMPLSPDIAIPTPQHKQSFDLEEARILQLQTTGQAACPLWHKEQEGKLTASEFGTIVKRKKISDAFIQSTYYPKPFTATATTYGSANESKAKQLYQETFPDRHVHSSGLILQPDLPFLGATPDAIVCDNGQTGLLEVKCLFAARDMTVAEAATAIKDFYVRKDGEDMHISERHNCYYQIQGQLLLSGLDFCDF